MRGKTVQTGLRSAMHRENHYVPRLYLKHFEAAPGKIQTYRLLVSHPHIPLWKLRSIGAIGYPVVLKLNTRSR